MWKVGDKAVCVDDEDCPYYPGSSNRVEKSIYTVVDVKPMTDVWGRGVTGLKMDRGNPIHPETKEEGWSNSVCFRPIVKADDDFIAQMRALKPKVKQ
jgi:hypothetical protein